MTMTAPRRKEIMQEPDARGAMPDHHFLMWATTNQ